MDLALDSVTNDVSFTEGDIVTITGIEAVAQRAADRLQTFRTEWFLDQDFGPNYIRDVLKKNPSLTLVKAIMIDQVNLAIGDDAVLSDFELTHEQATRLLEVNFVLRDPETQEEAEKKVVIG